MSLVTNSTELVTVLAGTRWTVNRTNGVEGEPSVTTAFSIVRRDDATTKEAWAVLLLGAVARTPEETDTTFCRSPDLPARRVTVTPAVALLSSVPIRQTTLPSSRTHVPALGVAETSVVPAGKALLNTTSVA